MGVAGTGKTTIGKALAAHTGWNFVDGDSLHPQANIDKMHHGIPLTDADRWPWLERVADWLRNQPGPSIVACSALRRAYRDALRQGRPDLRLIYLEASAEVLSERLRHR